jgi:hypothetical protein
MRERKRNEEVLHIDGFSLYFVVGMYACFGILHGGPVPWAWKEVLAAMKGFPNIEIDDTAGYPSWEEDINAYHFNDPVRRNQLCHYIGVVLAKDKNIGTLKQYEEAVDNGYKPSFTDMSRVDWNYDVFLLNYHGIIAGKRNGIRRPEM